MTVSLSIGFTRPAAMPPHLVRSHLGGSQLVRARRALLQRQPLFAAELDDVAALRRATTLKRQRPRLYAGGALLVAAGLALCVLGSQSARVSLLAGGFGLGLVGLALLIHAALTAVAPAHINKLHDYYLPGEHTAGSEEIAVLSRAATDDPEIAALVAPWWDSVAPIRLQDIDLVIAFIDAKRRG